MRGALELDQRACDHPRIIPADAGSTTDAPAKDVMAGNHPRGCGEHASREETR